MEIGLTILKLSLCLSLVVVVSCAQAPSPWNPSPQQWNPSPAPWNPSPQPWNPSMWKRPGTCDQYECPAYKLVEAGNNYEIRLYDSLVWISTGLIPSPSMTQASTTGFQRLFNYILGDNKSKTKLNMTAPVVTQATPGKSVYTVSFYLPKKNQQNPPMADDLHVQPWKPTHVAVRRFSGWVTDDAAKKEVAALIASLKGTAWIAPIEKNKGELPEYLVAGYNPPFQIINRINEIMIPFNM